jgi:hypothetical protein
VHGCIHRSIDTIDRSSGVLIRYGVANTYIWGWSRKKHTDRSHLFLQCRGRRAELEPPCRAVPSCAREEKNQSDIVSCHHVPEWFVMVRRRESSEATPPSRRRRPEGVAPFYRLWDEQGGCAFVPSSSWATAASTVASGVGRHKSMSARSSL